MTRLTSALWVEAYRLRLEAEGIPAYVTARGDATAGAVVVKLATLDGRARAFQRITALDGSRPWDVLAEGDETEVDAAVARARRFDPDLWVIEVEDRHGRHRLDAPGLE
ncbi:MAG: DUF1491 family protein [Deinococcus-Thermus bacterium]|jgi:hypothetical protein|nr:DUF1491 family protein [Deinococcota bacterium]